MLQLRPSCECCDTDLPPESADARAAVPAGVDLGAT
jgi:hypothetical protein